MQIDAKGDRDFSLRHSIAPYRVLATLFLLLLGWSFVDSYRSRNWGFFQSILLISGCYLLSVLIGLWYGVGLRNGFIWQRAFGGRRVLLPIKDITSIDREMSDVKTLLAMNRPLDRITIQGNVEGRKVIVDVSTKHFVASDIRRLIQAIHEARPELALPENWRH